MQTQVSTWHTYPGEPGPNRVLPGGKGRSTGSAALLGVVIGEFDHPAGSRDQIDVSKFALSTHIADSFAPVTEVLE